MILQLVNQLDRWAVKCYKSCLYEHYLRYYDILFHFKYYDFKRNYDTLCIWFFSKCKWVIEIELVNKFKDEMINLTTTKVLILNVANIVTF